MTTRRKKRAYYCPMCVVISAVNNRCGGVTGTTFTLANSMMLNTLLHQMDS